MWSIYPDDFTKIAAVARDVALALAGHCGDSQAKLHALYAHWNIPTNAGKALLGVVAAERLGYAFDGDLGWFGVTNTRAARILTLALELLRWWMVPALPLQVWFGQKRACLADASSPLVLCSSLVSAG